MKSLVLIIGCLLLTHTAYPYLSEAQTRRIVTDAENILALGGDRMGYAASMAERFRSNAQKHSRPWRERRRVSAFDMFSGALAIRESLQLETIGRSVDLQAMVAVNTLQGPATRSHDFVAMLKGRKVLESTLAAHAPPDWFYAHFSSLTRALEMADYLNQTGGALYNRFSEAPLESHLKTRILNQLAIVENREARKFYDAVISEMVLTSSDFFFAMGTDVSLVFKLRQKMIFESTIHTYRAKFLKDIPAARRKSVLIEGATVDQIEDPTQRLRSLLYIDDDFAIISNSPIALARLIRVHKKKEAAINTVDDFRYMRSVYQANTETEDGFMYFSDSFIRRLVSPGLRIAEARRMHIAFELAELERLALLHKHAYGNEAQNIRALLYAVARNKQEESELSSRFNDFELLGLRARHQKAGMLGFLLPNLENPLAKVSAAEAKSYAEFVHSYSAFWRDFFDPIGIRFKKTNTGAQIELCILPLIDNSIYNSITSMIGGLPTSHTWQVIKGETLSLAVKISPEIMAAAKAATPEGAMLENMTGNIQLHALDNSPNVDFNTEILLESFTRGRMRIDSLFGVIAWSLFHPLRVSLEVKDTQMAKAQLLQLQKLDDHHRRWRTFDGYSYKYRGHEIHVLVVNIANIVTFRFHGWLDGKMLHVTTTRAYLENYIDAEKTAGTHRGNMVAVFRPNQLSHEKSAIIQSGAESVRTGCLSHLGTIQLAAVVFPNENPAKAWSNRYGFTPVCAAGGSYEVEKSTAVHTLIGSHGNSRADMKAAETMLSNFFGTEQFNIYFEFTREGIMTNIETK